MTVPELILFNKGKDYIKSVLKAIQEDPDINLWNKKEDKVDVLIEDSSEVVIDNLLQHFNSKGFKTSFSVTGFDGDKIVLRDIKSTLQI